MKYLVGVRDAVEVPMTLVAKHGEIARKLLASPLVSAVMDVQALGRVAELTATFGALDCFVAPRAPFVTR